MEFGYELKIPKERIAVLIGKNGEIKKELEEESNSTIEVDSKEGDIKIKGEDSLKMYELKDVIMAIGRGFNPDIAKLLFRTDYVLEIIQLLDFVPSKQHFERVKGRIIGAKGKSRATIEKLTDTFISVYGKTIAIIGESENVPICRKAVESLLQGSQHANVYKFLEKNKRRQRQEKAIDW